MYLPPVLMKCLSVLDTAVATTLEGWTCTGDNAVKVEASWEHRCMADGDSPL